jgi:hypothetical protein
LLGILTDLWKWHEDEALFIQDNRTRSGGKTVLHPGLQLRWTNKSAIVADDVLKWVGFKQILRKWHRKLAKVSFFVVLLTIGIFDLFRNLVLHRLHSNWGLHACL